jgi:hypothetical protein
MPAIVRKRPHDVRDFPAVSLLDRIRSWWSKDTVERAEEETHMTPVERDQAEEDYQARKDDVLIRERLGGQGVDFERDSEPPPHP